MLKLNKRGAYLTRVLDDGRVLDVVPLTLGRVRIVISDSLADMSWRDGW